MKYQKRPVVIEAVQFSGEPVQFAANSEHPEWLKLAFANGTVFPHPIFSENRLQVMTTEGAMMADQEDWIIQGVEGELYPCKPSVFEATYDEVG